MRRTLLLLLLVLPGFASVHAAEPFTNAAEEEERAAAEQEMEAADEAEAGEDAEAEEDTAATRQEGNGDFVPSVQISEDLSVSFPTDI